MIILDTDHVTILKYGDHPQCLRLKEALRTAARIEPLATTIVNADEQLSGWLGKIHHERDIRRQVRHYAQLAGVLSFYSLWRVEMFDEQAADQFLILRSQRLRIGTNRLHRPLPRRPAPIGESARLPPRPWPARRELAGVIQCE